MESSVRSAQSVQTFGGGNDHQVIDRFMLNWMPFAMLPPGSRARTSIMRFLAAETPDDRARALEYASTLYRLQRHYKDLGILRTERAYDPYTELLGLTRQKMAIAIRQGNTTEMLGLLQRAFEFGRNPVPPQHHAARTFLLEFWSLESGGPNMKYCIYANGIPYSGGGKTHEEMARQFVATGLGNGLPLCGGLIYRIEDLVFQFDVSSTAFRANVQPEQVRHAILRWIHATGADETKVKLLHTGR
jgi:hypothetical protein